jgi:hypothetical protein
MTNTRRVTIAQRGNAVPSRPSSSSSVSFPREYLNGKPSKFSCQAQPHWNPRRSLLRGPAGKMTFAAILEIARPEIISRLKDRAFIANRVAKVAVGSSRQAAYAVKDAAMHTLVRVGAGRMLRLYGRAVGVEFSGGGRLHFKVSVAQTERNQSNRNPIWGCPRSLAGEGQ